MLDGKTFWLPSCGYFDNPFDSFTRISFSFITFASPQHCSPPDQITQLLLLSCAFYLSNFSINRYSPIIFISKSLLKHFVQPHPYSLFCIFLFQFHFLFPTIPYNYGRQLQIRVSELEPLFLSFSIFLAPVESSNRLEINKLNLN